MTAGPPARSQKTAAGISLTDSDLFDLELLTSSRQTTDVYLAALCFSHQGRLATLDTNIAWRAVRGASANLVDKIIA